ncbi:MAG: hypothetical protein NTW04_01315 [Elusimicrobia bacterium]|nr:hypothetical protein [Elusimicrobiota bacterium]
MQGQRILLLWIGRLGDLLSATAFIRAMRQKFPDAKITLLTRGYVRDLAEILSGIDERIYLPSPGALRGAGGFFSHFLLKKFDLCVDLNTSYSRTSGALVILSKAQKRVSFDKKGARFFYTDTIAAASRDEHMLSCYGRLAQFFSAPYTPEMKIEIPDGDISRAQKILSSLNLKPDALKIAVHPGNFKKFDHRWPKGKFIELSKKILSLPDVELIYIAGPGEEKPVKTQRYQIPLSMTKGNPAPSNDRKVSPDRLIVRTLQKKVTVK